MSIHITLINYDEHHMERSFGTMRTTLLRISYFLIDNTAQNVKLQAYDAIDLSADIVTPERSTCAG